MGEEPEDSDASRDQTDRNHGDESGGGGWVQIPVPPTVSEGLVWHYTDAKGLVGILQSHEIWASSAGALNDTSELKYGYELLKSVWNRRDSFEPPLPVPCAQFVDAVLSSDLSTGMDNTTFIVSASMDGDLLNQWQHYGRGGFALGLDPQQSLAPTVIRDGPLSVNDPAFLPGWKEVIYAPDQQEEWAWDMLTFTASCTPGSSADWRDHLPEWPRRISSCFLSLRSLICQFKNPNFAAEREARFVAGSAAIGPIEQFREVAGRVLPYVALSRTTSYGAYAFGQSERLPIRAVRCGPSSDKNVLVTVSNVLVANGYDDVEVTLSGVPYRDTSHS